MTPIDALRAVVDDAFRPATRYTSDPPTLRRHSDFTATLAIPLDLASVGFTVAVRALTTGGYALTVTRAAVGAMPRITVTASGPTWCAACVESRHQLLQRLTRIEADQRKAAERMAA